MRHALAILKYLPAVLCGLLLVAWVVSQLNSATITIALGEDRYEAQVCWGEIRLWHHRNSTEPAGVRWWGPMHWENLHWEFGTLDFRTHESGSFCFFPITILFSLLLPLAISPFNRFRFSLWSWFAFTALVAVELAYYLR